MTQLHCPRCGDPLVEDDGEVGCRRGQMPLSPRMLADLTACFVEGTRAPSEVKLAFPIGGRWFCPRCGSGMKEDAGDLRCGHCDGLLNEFVHHLVELHPHVRTPGQDPVDPTEATRIARSWIETLRHSWAYDAVSELLRDDPVGALAALDAVVEQTDSDELRGLVGAGPLEDLVRDHGSKLIDQLEARAARDPRWRTAFEGVWLPDGDDQLTARLEALGCTQLRNR